MTTPDSIAENIRAIRARIADTLHGEDRAVYLSEFLGDFYPEMKEREGRTV